MKKGRKLVAALFSAAAITLLSCSSMTVEDLMKLPRVRFIIRDLSYAEKAMKKENAKSLIIYSVNGKHYPFTDEDKGWYHVAHSENNHDEYGISFGRAFAFGVVSCRVWIHRFINTKTRRIQYSMSSFYEMTMPRRYTAQITGVPGEILYDPKRNIFFVLGKGRLEKSSDYYEFSVYGYVTKSKPGLRKGQVF